MIPDCSAPIVLVVEDEWLIREEIAHELQDAGWNVLEASTGEGAVALLQKGQQIDAVVTDIRLAGYLSGWDVAEAFRAVHPDIPVIYASATSSEKSRRVPGSVFFTKPYRTAEVLNACRGLAASPRPEGAAGKRAIPASGPNASEPGPGIR